MSDEDCPHCHKHILDLWEYFAGVTSHHVAAECPHCEQPILVCTDVVLIVKKRTPPRHEPKKEK